MTLHQLSIWIVIAKYLNVTKAADDLNIKQPSVSQQIKWLENDSGIKLYKVNKDKGIELTEAGKILLKYAKKTLLQVKILENKSSYIEHEVWIPVFDHWGELPLLPFGNPIGFVPASRGGVYIELKSSRKWVRRRR